MRYQRRISVNDNIKINVRSEELSIDDFIKLSDYLSN